MSPRTRLMQGIFLVIGGSCSTRSTRDSTTKQAAMAADSLKIAIIRVWPFSCGRGTPLTLGDNLTAYATSDAAKGSTA